MLDLVGATASNGEQTGTLPIGYGIGSLADADAGVQAAKVALAAAKPGAAAFPAGRRRATQPGASSVMAAVAPARQGQDTIAMVASPLQNHPELGANGEMIRRPPRSVVAEAHRKALERRENERELADQRRKEQQEAALATLFPSSSSAAKPSGSGGTAMPRPVETAAALPTQPSLPTSAGGAGGGAAQVPVPRAAAPVPPREPEDRQIIPDAPALPLELASKPVREDLGVALPPAAAPLADIAPAPLPRLPEPVARAPHEAVTASSPSRYWDDPAATPRFDRMPRPEPSDPPLPHTAPSLATTQPVSSVGRARPEPQPPVEAPAGRTIRPLPTRGATTPVDGDGVPKPPPARMPRPTPAAESRPTEPALPTLPPRQIDEQLLQQLQQDWRERTLAAHAGQRCGTCRYFQALDGAERGSCACPFAGSYRQAQGRQDLGCINSFGTWWTANDDGWLQKTDLGPRQPTPMVDQLLKEWGIPDVPPSVAGPRRDAR